MLNELFPAFPTDVSSESTKLHPVGNCSLISPNVCPNVASNTFVVAGFSILLIVTSTSSTTSVWFASPAYTTANVIFPAFGVSNLHMLSYNLLQ